MGQLGFFDLNRRYESLTEKNDPLVDGSVRILPAQAAGELRRSEAERRNSAGRKPWDDS
jgi:hypothetical protein